MLKSIRYTNNINMKNFYKLLLLTLFLLFLSPQNSALATGCVDEPSRVAAITIDITGIYDVYIKGSDPNGARVQLRATGEGTCSVLSSDSNAGTNWTTVGKGVLMNAGTVEVSLGDAHATSTSSKPEILLINQSYPAQVRGGFIYVQYDGKSAVLHPRVLSQAEAAVTVSTVENPYDDEIRKVDYYADGEFVYSKRELEDFSKYQSIRQDVQMLSTIVYFTSGQSLTLEMATEAKQSSSVDFIAHLYRQSSTLIKVLAVGISIIVGIELFIGLLRYREYRHKWLVAHGFRSQNQHSAIGRWIDYVMGTNFGTMLSTAGRLGRITVPIIMLIIGIMWFFIDMYAVDGISMEPTLKNGSRVVVSKTEKTFAFLGNGSMKLSRGDIVVVDSEMSVLPPSPSRKYIRSTVVKRVVGLPGDTVKTKDSEIYVTAPNKTTHEINPINASTEQGSDEHRSNDLKIVLGPDELFIVGDNRSQSIDSRFYGPVKIDRVIGKVIYTIQF